jgi:homocysteine S-methyltransferase
MALESELLGAHALDVRNILALTGDPPRVGDYPTGTGIWDVDSVGLIGILSRLNRGEDQAGKPIGSPAGFTIACALDPTAADLDQEMERLAAKIDAGANVIMTQPIYGFEQWDRFMQAATARWPSGLPRPVLLGILPLHTHRHAEFLHNEVPGITIPDEVRAAMAAAGERGAEVGLEMAHSLLEQMRPLVDGTYIMPSFGRYELAAELVRRIRAAGRVTAQGITAQPEASV